MHTIITEREAREKETQRLERLSRRVAKIAKRIEVAAAYHEDAAFDTARAILREQVDELDNALRYLSANKWHDRAWRESVRQSLAASA